MWPRPPWVTWWSALPGTLRCFIALPMEEIILPAVLPSRYTSCTVLQADEKNGDGRDDVLIWGLWNNKIFVAFLPIEEITLLTASGWGLRRDFDRHIFHSFVMMRYYNVSSNTKFDNNNLDNDILQIPPLCQELCTGNVTDINFQVATCRCICNNIIVVFVATCR